MILIIFFLSFLNVFIEMRLLVVDVMVSSFLMLIFLLIFIIIMVMWFFFSVMDVCVIVRRFCEFFWVIVIRIFGILGCELFLVENRFVWVNWRLCFVLWLFFLVRIMLLIIFFKCVVLFVLFWKLNIILVLVEKWINLICVLLLEIL